MKLTGNEWVSLQVENNGKPQFTICQLTLTDLLNSAIKWRVSGDLDNFNKVKKYDTQFFAIKKYSNKLMSFEDIKLRKKTKVDVKFEISLKKGFAKLKKDKIIFYRTNLDIRDLYNYIISIYENCLHDFNVSLKDITLKLTEVKLKEGI